MKREKLSIINFFKTTINSIERSKTPFIYFIFSFIFMITLRNFLEIFSDIHCPITAPNIFHYDISYTALAILLILLLYSAIRTSVVEISKIVLTSFVILNIVPVIDLLLSGGNGFDIAYLSPENFREFLIRFVTFFGSFENKGITPGIKIEVFFVLSGIFLYLLIKTSRVLKSLFYTLISYTLIFFYLSFPFIIKIVMNLLDLEFLYSNIQFINFYLFIIFFSTIRLFYLYDRKVFITIIRDIRPFRLIHFLLMFVAGLVLGSFYFHVTIRSEDPFSLFFTGVGITLAWMFSVMTNNIADLNIDKISNHSRPLITGSISLKLYKRLSYSILVVCLLYSWIVHFRVFFFISLFIGNYFLYSMPPFRLKRILIFSKLIISLNSLILMMLGFISITGTLEYFPDTMILYLLIPFTLAINFIDIKDYAGDKKEGIKTLPVLLGIKKAKLLIGFFFVLSYFSVYFIIPSTILLALLVVFSIIQFYLINKKKYNEKWIFFVYLISVIFSIIYLAAFKVHLQ